METVNPANDLLWDCLKGRVSLRTPTIDELKDSIACIVADIPEHELSAAVYSIKGRLLLVQEENAEHIQYLR